MITPPDPYALEFDSIEIERAPSPAAVATALAAVAPHDQPGFYLIDDASGRFVIDREFGVVSLRDEALLAAEHGQTHGVRVKVIESTGDSYELAFTLRITGMVPQMLGAEDFGFGSEATPAPAPQTARAPHVSWTAFAAARGLQSKPALNPQGAYGALLAPTLPHTHERISIAFGEAIPAPAPAHAHWSL